MPTIEMIAEIKLLKDQNKKIREENAMNLASLDAQSMIISNMQKQIEDMKCCGNCNSAYVIDWPSPLNCKTWMDAHTFAWSCCEYWKERNI